MQYIQCRIHLDTHSFYHIHTLRAGAFRIVSDKYVTDDSGTGVVHQVSHQSSPFPLLTQPPSVLTAPGFPFSFS